MKRLTRFGFWTVGAGILIPFFLATAWSVAGGQEVARRWWERIGPPGGRVVVLASNSVRPWQVIAGLDSGGIYVSDDGGASWQGRYPGLVSNHFEDFAVSSRDPSIMAATFSGLVLSTDSGRNWRPLDLGFEYAVVSRVAFDPFRNAGLVALATNSDYREEPYGVRVLRSDDLGATWTNISPPIPFGYRIRVFEYHPSLPDTLYVGMSQGSLDLGRLFKSSDGGGSWVEIQSGRAGYTLAIDPHSPDTLLYLQEGSLLRSIDGGVTWLEIELPEDGAWTEGAIKFDPTHPSTVYAVARWLYRSHDGGLSWHIVLSYPQVSKVRDFELDPADSSHLLVASFEGGLISSRDSGATWADSSDGLLSTFVNAVWINPQNRRHVLAAVEKPLNSHPGLYLTTDGGATWVNVYSTGWSHLKAIATSVYDPEILYAVVVTPSTPGSPGGEIIRSFDGGHTWSTVFETEKEDDGFIGFSVHPRDSRTAYASSETGLYITEDGGDSWRQTGSGAVRGIVMDPDNVGSLFGYRHEPSPTRVAIVRTRDGGLSWTEVPAPQPRSYSYHQTPVIAIDPNDGDTVLVGTEHRLLLSIDGGDHWRRIDEPFRGRYWPVRISCVAVDPNDSSRFYVADGSSSAYRGGRTGLWTSPDRGGRWTQLNDGLAVQDVWSLWVGLNGSLGVGSAGGGVFVHIPRFPLRPSGRRLVR